MLISKGILYLLQPSCGKDTFTSSAQQMLMKRLSLISAMVLALVPTSMIHAQEAPAPIIKDLRALVQSGKVNFQDQVGALLEVDTPTRIAIYKTAKESAGATTAVMQSLDGGKPDLTQPERRRAKTASSCDLLSNFAVA